MVLLQFLLVATAAALDVTVTCGSAPDFFTIDGVANKQLSIVAGDSIFFHMDAGCVADAIQIQQIDGTPFPAIGPITTLVTTGATPSCLIYASMAHPLTMTGTITIIGGLPCGATLTASTTLYNRPIITPLPTLYASGSLSVTLPTVCPVQTCPAISCVSPAYSKTDTMANGCLGCPYCFTPATTVTVLPPVVCPVRACPLLLACILPTVQRVDTLANGCSGCPYCARPGAVPCVGLYCLPCCATALPGQACRSCVSFF